MRIFSQSLKRRLLERKNYQHVVVAKFFLCNWKMHQKAKQLFQVLLSVTYCVSDVVVFRSGHLITNVFASWKRWFRIDTSRNSRSHLNSSHHLCTSPAYSCLAFLPAAFVTYIFFQNIPQLRNVVQSKPKKKKKIFEIAFLLHIRNASVECATRLVAVRWASCSESCFCTMHASLNSVLVKQLFYIIITLAVPHFGYCGL